jgi:hypothetical protein
MAWLGFSCGKTAFDFNLGFVFWWLGAEIRHFLYTQNVTFQS